MAVLGHVLGRCSGGGGIPGESIVGEKTADPSTTLRSGRDDKGEGSASIECRLADGKIADPSASLGMTKGRAALPLGGG